MPDPHALDAEPSASSSSPLIISIAIALSLVVVGLVFFGPKEILAANSQAIESWRNFFIMLAAAFGIPFVIWRTFVAQQQADASERQADTAALRLRNEIYEKGAAMLGDSTPSVRLGGIYSLKRLANEKPDEYQDQVMELLCAFVRNPTPDEGNARVTDGDGGALVPRVLRDDVQTVMNIIVRRHLELREGSNWGKHKPLDLRGATLQAVDSIEGNLAGALLHDANLAKGQLRDAKLAQAQMVGGVLKGADLSAAGLEGCRFVNSDLSGIRANGADFSRCTISSVDLSRAIANGTVFSRSNISGSSLQKAVLQRAKLVDCTIANTDFRGASMWRADVSGTKFRKATRVRGTERGTTKEVLYCLLTQAQLDEAVAHPDFPPEIEAGTVDAETGKPLTWRGDCITADQHHQVYGPQQIVKEGSVERRVGTYVEWNEMGLRLVPGMVERIRRQRKTLAWQKICELLENRNGTDDWVRITFYGRGESDVESCGITWHDGEGKIWILFVYREEGFSEASERFVEKGPETEERWKEWIDKIDWTRVPLVERRPGRINDRRMPRQTV